MHTSDQKMGEAAHDDVDDNINGEVGKKLGN